MGMPPRTLALPCVVPPGRSKPLDLGARTGVLLDEAVGQLLCAASLGRAPWPLSSSVAAEPVQSATRSVSPEPIYLEMRSSAKNTSPGHRENPFRRKADLDEIALGTVHRHALHADKAGRCRDARATTRFAAGRTSVGERLDAVAVRVRFALGLLCGVRAPGPSVLTHQPEIRIFQ